MKLSTALGDWLEGMWIDATGCIESRTSFLRGIIFGGEKLRSQILISKQSLKCPSELARRINAVY